MMWRTGRKVGRTIYRQLGLEASDNDPLIGVMDSAEDAATVVRAVNGETPPLIGMYGGPLIELYRMWTARDGREHIAVYMPGPDDSPNLRHYVEDPS